MPELPEVETVLRTLEYQIKDEEITYVKVIHPMIVEDPTASFEEHLVGQHFRGFLRRGKYLIFVLDQGYFISHLRMEGKYFLQDPSESMNKHIHVVIGLKNGKELRYHDTRKFGRMYTTSQIDLDTFHGLGVEPLTDAFNQQYFHQRKKGRSLPIKSLLLDQSFVAGIGNIYADEILSACHIRPGRSCKRITIAEEKMIVEKTKEILSQAIEMGGTTIRSYTSSLGVTGRFQLYCSVHMQKQCHVCNETIKVKTIGGRSSYYCPNCQK